MSLPKTLEKELNDRLFFRIEAILIYSRCVKVLTPVAVKSKLHFQGLLERSCAQSLEDFEVDRFKMMEGFLIKKEHLLIGMSLEGQLAHGQTTTNGTSKGKKEKEYVGGRRHIEILADDLKSLASWPNYLDVIGKERLWSVVKW